MATTTTLEQAEREFRRMLRNLESVQYRQRSGQLTGRNAPPDETRYCRELWALCKANEELYDLLDRDTKLSARFKRAERRAYGLPL